MHSLNLTEIHLSRLTLLWFNWVFYISNLFNSCLLSNCVKKLPLRQLRWVCLDWTAFAEIENWKHCSKIIFKCVNSIVGLIFNEKVAKKWNLWVREHCSQKTDQQLRLKRQKKRRKCVGRRRSTYNPNPNSLSKGKKIFWEINYHVKTL